MFIKRLYIQISPNQIRISAFDGSCLYEEPPIVAIQTVGEKKVIAAIGRDASRLEGKAGISLVNPLDHPRVIIGDFTISEKLLQHAVRTALNWRWVRPLTSAVIHSEGNLEGGLTQIESRALRELCLAAGIRKCFIYVGRPLTPSELAELGI